MNTYLAESMNATTFPECLKFEKEHGYAPIWGSGKKLLAYEYWKMDGQIVDVIAPIDASCLGKQYLGEPCPYCRSLHALNRCPSCGAPRMAGRNDYELVNCS